MYLELSHLFWIALLFLGAFYWWNAYGIKQMALQMTKAHCHKMELQMLDESIALGRISIKRGDSGSLQLVRFFNFEFSSMGDERYHGQTTMHGRRCIDIQLDAHRF